MVGHDPMQERKARKMQIDIKPLMAAIFGFVWLAVIVAIFLTFGHEGVIAFLSSSHALTVTLVLNAIFCAIIGFSFWLGRPASSSATKKED